jgi:transposase
MGDMYNFERIQIVGVLSAGVSVAKTVTLQGVSRATVSKVMLTYTSHGKTTSAKRNSGQKSTLTERDRCALSIIVLKNYRTAAAQVTAELTFILKTLLA